MSKHLLPFTDPFRASVVEGEVVISGGGVCASYMPAAALESAERLRSAAEAALRNEVQRADDVLQPDITELRQA